MIGLAEPPDRWDAETARPGVVSTGPAASPSGLVITADTTRHESVERFHDCRISPKIQGAFWLGRVRLQNWRA